MKQTILCEKLFKDFSSYFESQLPKVGLNLQALYDPNFEISEEKFVELFELVGENEHDSIGLVIGIEIFPEHIGALGHAVVNAANVEQGIKIIEDFVVTYSHFSDIKFTRKNDAVEISYQISDPTILNKRQDAEFAIAAIYRMLILCAGQYIPLTSVSFEHEKPRCIDKHEEIFDCPITFNTPVSTLVFSKACLAFSSGKRDSRLFDILSSHLNEERKRREVKEFQSELSCILAAQLSSGNTSINHISKLMGVSVRTLQRRLDDNNLDFSYLLNSVRQGLAQSYLKEDSLTLSEISQKLGYKESSSFTRAFKRWKGLTPKDYRQSLNINTK